MKDIAQTFAINYATVSRIVKKIYESMNASPDHSFLDHSFVITKNLVFGLVVCPNLSTQGLLQSAAAIF